MRSCPARRARRSSTSSARARTSTPSVSPRICARASAGPSRTSPTRSSPQRLAKNLRVYNEPDVARRLTRECLRFLYRILFLLYAEARPELGHRAQPGRGLPRRLRPRPPPRARAHRARRPTHANNGTHLHDSLDILFELVNDGYHHEFAQQQFTESGDAIDDTGLIFEPLHSELFGPNATPLLDSIRLRNEVVQQVLARLLLDPGEGRPRAGGSSPTPTLGINQLGAVYEGLMAYTGFFADEDLYEVASRRRRRRRHLGGAGREVPTSTDDEVFVTERSATTAARRRVIHKKGSLRLPPLRARPAALGLLLHARGAHPCVVKHALEELLDQNGGRRPAPTRSSTSRSASRRSGPARSSTRRSTSSSAEYLRAQAGRARRHARPRQYAARAAEGQGPLRPAPVLRRRPQRHRRRARRGLAVAQLHAPRPARTVVRPAPAPRQLAHRRSPRGLSRLRSLPGRKWLKAVPEDRPLATETLGARRGPPLPAARRRLGGGQRRKEAKELRTDAVDALKNVAQGRRPRRSARQIATGSPRWLAASRRCGSSAIGTARRWPSETYDARSSSTASRPRRRQAGSRRAQRSKRRWVTQNSPLARLRLVMDAWCALWFWPLEPAARSPRRRARDWLATFEGLLGIDRRPTATLIRRSSTSFADLDALEAREAELRLGSLMPTVDEVREQHPWLDAAREIAEREGFFHWELEFAPVFRRGGFDLQVGNPPWVRPRLAGRFVLAERDPWFGLAGGLRSRSRTRRRRRLRCLRRRDAYLDEVARRGWPSDCSASARCVRIWRDCS